MKWFEAIKLFGILLMVAIVMSFFGCGENEEMPVEPVNSDSIPVTVEQVTPTVPPQPPAEIVWVEIADDGSHIEREYDPNTKTRVEFFDQIQDQDVIIVKVKDADGNPVWGARVEWMLNTRPGAVGDIVETDDPGHQDIPPAAAPQIKVDNSFAITFTNSEDEVTPPQLKGMGPDGANVTIERGETWIIITSISEGDTDITAFAPAIPRDQTHKIFAVKHWTCINLIPPTPTLTCINYCTPPPGDPNEEMLESTVTNVCDGSLMPDITVRYTILPGGPNAVWEENGAKVIDVVSDVLGKAQATIELDLPLPVPSLVIPPNLITVEAFDVDGRLVAKEDDIPKDWGSAFLSITMPCPQSVAICNEVNLDITVTNTGECPAGNVMVDLEYPVEAFDLLSPAALPTSAGGSTPVNVRLMAKKVGTWLVQATAVSEECVEAIPVVCNIAVVEPTFTLTCRAEPRAKLVNDPDTPEENQTTIILTVNNPCTYDVEGTYVLTATLPSTIVPPILPIVAYIPGTATPQPAVEPPPGNVITWNISTIGPGANEFTFEIEGTNLGEGDITTEFSGIPGEPCPITIVVTEKCSLIILLPNLVTGRVGEEIDVEFRFENTGMRGATFELNKILLSLEEGKEGLEIVRITHVQTHQQRLPANIAEDGSLEPTLLIADIAPDNVANLIVTVKGLRVGQTDPTVTVEGTYHCPVILGEPRLLKGSATVRVE